MRIASLALRSFVALALALPLSARAADPADEAAKLYEVEMSATPSVAKGSEGELVIRIKPKPGAEIHKEAPISLALDARNVEPGQKKVGRKELKMEGENGSFTVPFKAVEAGAGGIDANLTFFICTDKVCARQQRKATLPVTVEG